MKNNRTLNLSVTALVASIHLSIGWLMWEGTKPVKPLAMDELTFVTLGGRTDGDNSPATGGAPAPLADSAPPGPKQPEKQPEKPSESKAAHKPLPRVETPKIKTSARNDVPADIRMSEHTPKPQPKTAATPDPQPAEPKPAAPKAADTAANTRPAAPKPSENTHREAGATGGGGGGDRSSKVPENGSGVAKNGSGKGAQGTGGEEKSSGNGGSISDGGYLTLPNPPYPAQAQDAGEEGSVKLSVTVEADGRVSGVTVIGGTARSPQLKNAAKRAAQTARYKPKSVDGRPVRTRFTTSFTFTL